MTQFLSAEYCVRKRAAGRTIFLTQMWKEILSRLNKINKVLKKPILTLSSSVTVLNSLHFQEKDSFERCVTKVEVIFESKSTYKESEGKCTIKRSPRIACFDRTQLPETALTEKDKLRIQASLPIRDTLVTNLKESYSKYDRVAKRFGFSKDFVGVPENELKFLQRFFGKMQWLWKKLPSSSKLF